MRTQEVCIEKSGIRGAPLVLGFEKVFGRAAVEGEGEGEGDIVFSARGVGEVGGQGLVGRSGLRAFALLIVPLQLL